MINRRRKGAKLEFEVQRWMKGRGQGFCRVGMSGQLEGVKGDFLWHPEGDDIEVYKGEAKSGSKVPKTLYDWLEKDEVDFLVVRRDRKPRLWVLTEDLLERLLK